MKNWLRLIQSFFPSWRFFDDAGPEFKLSVRVGQSESQLGEWINCLQPIPRSLKTILINPHAGYLHAARNLVTRLSSDISDIDENDTEKIAEVTTFKIVKNLVRFQINELKLAHPPFVFQFRLSATSMKHLNEDADQLLISSVYES